MNEHLERAKMLLAVADSGDSKKEAYRLAAEEVFAYKQETGDSNVNVATLIGRSDMYVNRLLKWRESGYEANTPFLADGQATQRAAKSHTKKVLRESSEDEMHSLIADLPPEQVKKLRRAAEDVEVQQHPATAIKPPLGMPADAEPGFFWAITRTHSRLVRAIEEYVEAWDATAEGATEEMRDTERERIAPYLLRLRMTVEEINA